MPDAHPAPAAAIPLPALPAVPSATGRPSRADATFAAAVILMPTLAAGRPLDAPTLRAAMTQAFGSTDAEGGWLLKDAYDAAETAVILFLRRYAAGLRRRAADKGPARMLPMLAAVAALEPSHTWRSREQVRLQQFSTPIPLAYAAFVAASVRPGDTVLEPSAGTGMLAVMARSALAPDDTLHLNEIARTRARLLARLFPESVVTSFDAETIADRLHGITPSVILMNPPFSASPGVVGANRHADLRHVRSAFSMLPPGGRLAAVTSSGCLPGDAAWRHAFDGLDPPARITFTSAMDGRAYSRRGTSFDTRLTVLDRTSEPSPAVDPAACAASAADLLDAVLRSVPARLDIEPVRRRPGAAADLFAGRIDRPRPAAPQPPPAAPSSPGRDRGPVALLAVEHGPANGNEPRPDPDVGAGPYEPWRPDMIRIPGARPHPSPLVQSSAMAAVRHPPASHRPLLPARIVAEGLLSDAQLESVVLAGDAHSRHLPTLFRIGSGQETVVPWATDGSPDSDAEDHPELPDADGQTFSAPVRFRRGWMCGDGTGVGKGREVAAIILDNRLQGRARALWLSESDKLLEDGRRDWSAIGGRHADIVPVSRFRQGAVIPLTDSVLFSTYATLRSPARQGKRSRLEQIVEWLAGSLDEADRHAFDGVIVFDEAHAMANAVGARGNRGAVRPSQQGRAGLRLQNALPNARIVYVSATGASTIPGLAYAVRLGLWGAGETPFNERSEFVAAMEAGGVAAMEVVARDLKALGLYQARALSYAGVEVDILEHRLTPEQRRIYDSYADAFHIIHGNLQAAFRESGIMQEDDTLNRNARAAALAAFEGMKQRFFGHLLVGMQCPSLLRSIQADLDAGRAAVVQLVSTGEALMERRIAEIPTSEWNDLSIDLTPRDGVLTWLRHAFPVHLQEVFTDEAGHLLSRPAVDADGMPILCQAALRRRDELIEQVAALPPVPTALDQIIHHFGHEAVAEVTGRSRRILRLVDSDGERLALRRRPASASLAETAAFMSGDKHVLVFSMAGGTGRSYHADLSSGNTDRRVHYLMEPGWRADKAIQGLGRTHRTHQASAPLFRPVTTDVKGQRRFIATIARRLDSLGAITRGQRNSQSSMGDGNASLFRDSDNLESPYAVAALRRFYIAVHHGLIDGWSVERFEDRTGLKIAHEGQLLDDLPPMPRFLNRLLALRIDDQNLLFAALEELIEANIEHAVQAGSYELGVETIRAESATIVSRDVLCEHAGAGAATDLVELLLRNPVDYTGSDDALTVGARHPTDDGQPFLCVNAQSGRAAVMLPAPTRIHDDGSVQPRVRLLRPGAFTYMARAEFGASSWRRTGERNWRALWDAELAGLPSRRETRIHLAVGLLLPVWDRIRSDAMRVRRLTTDDGQTLIGRLVEADQVRDMRRAFGLRAGPPLTGDRIVEAVMQRGKSFAFDNGWRLARRRVMGADRIEVSGPVDTDINALRLSGCVIEIVQYRARVFIPDSRVLQRVLDRWPLDA